MSKRIGYLGVGTWGFCLASLLAKKGYPVLAWTIDAKLAERLNHGKEHPHLPGHTIPSGMEVTLDLDRLLRESDFLVEGVTSAGLRPVLSQVKEKGVPKGPIVITSKGIEQGTGLLLTDLAVEALGEEHRHQIGCVSGPSHAEEVIQGLPTSVVCSAYAPEVMMEIQDTFTTSTFRVYPNADIEGIEFGGAMKNIIAIACGLSDGLGFGDNTKAALMTRGLHEIRKLAQALGFQPETLNGLAGMGDLCVTCLSIHSRNYRFGRSCAQGNSPKKAQQEIGMVVEGVYSCVSARELGEKLQVALPITDAVYRIIYEDLSPREAVSCLLTRAIKEEHL